MDQGDGSDNGVGDVYEHTRDYRKPAEFVKHMCRMPRRAATSFQIDGNDVLNNLVTVYKNGA